MITNLKVKVNNEKAEGVDVRVVNGRPVISWVFSETEVVKTDEYGLLDTTDIVDQKNFQIQLGTSEFSVGTWQFSANVQDTGIVPTTERLWAYTGPVLERGVTYYGQLRIKDEEDEVSDWKTFTLTFNGLPGCKHVVASPSQASVSDDISLSFDFNDSDGDTESGTIIKWFKNGEHQRQFNNDTKIESDFLSYGDIWIAHVFPSDGHEFGPKGISNTVTVSTSSPVSSNIEILPHGPNENDILEASYSFSADITDDKSRIRWFVNNSVVDDLNDQKFARPDVVPGDTVRFEVQPFDGVTFSDIVVSETVTIVSSSFVVKDIRVDGIGSPLDVLSLKPVISWDVISPAAKERQYMDIRIGTAPGGDNIYAATIKTQSSNFTVPSNILTRGSDYYISLSVSDIETFGNYTISHFRTSGSRWTQDVSNSTGWTIEAVFNVEIGAFDEANYQIIRIQDGTRFVEVRIYADRIGIFSEEITFSEITNLSSSGYKILTIVGKGDDVKLYLDRKIALDGTGLMTQVSDDKRLEFGSIAPGVVVRWQSINYTVTSDFHPDSSTDYNVIQFHEYAQFPSHEAIGLKGFLEESANKKVFAVNPNDENSGGSVYAIVPGTKEGVGAVARTFSPINDGSKSTNAMFKVFGHARGASIFKSYLINNFDHKIDFTDSSIDVNPDKNGWELVQNVGISRVTVTDDGLDINTSQS